MPPCAAGKASWEENFPKSQRGTWEAPCPQGDASWWVPHWALDVREVLMSPSPWAGARGSAPRGSPGLGRLSILCLGPSPQLIVPTVEKTGCTWEGLSPYASHPQWSEIILGWGHLQHPLPAVPLCNAFLGHSLEERRHGSQTLL